MYSYTHIFIYINLNIYDIYWGVVGIIENCVKRSEQKRCYRSDNPVLKDSFVKLSAIIATNSKVLS